MKVNRKIAFVIFSDPMIYPPTMNAAAILADHGFEVDIFGLHYHSGDYIEPALGVKVHYLGELRKGIWFRFDFARFCIQVVLAASFKQYQWIFSYNMTGVLPGYLAARLSGARWLYHNHDLTPVRGKWGFYPFLNRMEKLASRRADLVVFPQAERAELFADSAGLKRKPLIVGNGPRRGWGDIVDLEREILDFRSRWGQVVIYQGGLNWMRGLRRVIESMPYWDVPAGLLLVGGTGLQPSFSEDAMAIARTLGVQDRLLIKSTIPYLDLPRFTKACDIGLGVMATTEDDSCLNIRYLAGASNKLAEYMSCGLPVVVPASETYRGFIEDNGVGILVDNSSPQNIAAGLNKLFLNSAMREEISARAKTHFASSLSYEAQFQPVLEAVSRDVD
ncbi:MAG: hypothetical protein CVU57_13505 [Deltaproteobacteria bacterium HGW-Deltaproteobacteria-15]|jgi:glycosyltransferase involved in cell wall biosynthesis|nr:MAG: hypothetical protein CVU57_13505 [Deltaproteobacteria bacterium HGW-Deltaproteobacteria-15]